MFGALVGFTGEVAIAKEKAAAASLDALMARVESMLEGAKATRVRREGASAQYTVRLFRLVSKANVLAMIDAGSIKGEDRGGVFALRYQASTRRFAVMAAASTASFFVIGAIVWGVASASPTPAPGWIVALSPVFVVVAYALNLVIARVRFKRWLRAGLTRAAP